MSSLLDLSGNQPILLSALNRLLKYNQHRAEANEYFEDCANRTYQLMDGCVNRMMLELDTAGKHI